MHSPFSTRSHLSVKDTEPPVTLPSTKLKQRHAGSYHVYPQLHGRNLSGFFNQSFSCCRTQVTHRVQSSPVHCSDPAGSRIIQNKTIYIWRVQRIKKKQNTKETTHRVCKSQKLTRYSPASVKVVQNMQIAIYFHAHRTVTL